MQYCNLGRSGLEVSRIGLGTTAFGTRFDVPECRRIVDMYADLGGNLVDTANMYGGGTPGTNAKLAGTAERSAGLALKGRRDRFVLATKGFWLMEDEVTPNSVGLSRTYLVRSVEASLRRLGTDYIDLYQCHAWDFYTPIEVTMRVLDDLVSAGKVRYAGASNWDGWHVVKASTASDHSGLTRPISNQIWYNLADRGVENSVVPACRDQGVGVIAWGALGQGFLSGIYSPDHARPESGSRFETMKPGESSEFQAMATPQNWRTLDLLRQFAEVHHTNVSAVAVAALLELPGCDVALVGGSSQEQFAAVLEATDVHLSTTEVDALRQSSEPAQPYPVNFLSIFCKREGPHFGGLR
jgi:aryl-alcohol dehydrogenase-like predicted oxidoreductase